MGGDKRFRPHRKRKSQEELIRTAAHEGLSEQHIDNIFRLLLRLLDKGGVYHHKRGIIRISFALTTGPNSTRVEGRLQAYEGQILSRSDRGNVRIARLVLTQVHWGSRDDVIKAAKRGIHGLGTHNHGYVAALAIYPLAPHPHIYGWYASAFLYQNKNGQLRNVTKILDDPLPASSRNTGLSSNSDAGSFFP